MHTICLTRQPAIQLIKNILTRLKFQLSPARTFPWWLNKQCTACVHNKTACNYFDFVDLNKIKIPNALSNNFPLQKNTGSAHFVCLTKQSWAHACQIKQSSIQFISKIWTRSKFQIPWQALGNGFQMHSLIGRYSGC